MLRNAKELQNYVLRAQDGEIGRVKDFLFDDLFWTIRYMVANTGKWLPGRKVLISPISLENPDWVSMKFPVALTTEQIKRAPGLDDRAPVSREYEIDWTHYYGWPHYWGGPCAWGTYAYPGLLYEQRCRDDRPVREKSRDDRLRSVHEVTGYHIGALDHDMGHVYDFLIEDQTWAIRYLVVDTRNWLPGKKVLVSPAWITSVDWEERKVVVNLLREQVENSPEYEPRSPLDRVYEEQLHKHYDRTAYWE